MSHQYKMRSRAKVSLRLFGAVSVVALWAAYPSAVHAQDEEGTDSRYSEIIVTAQFREQNLQDTPIAITAVNAETLEARSQTSVTDLGQYAPNVALAPATSLQGNAVAAFIRGVGQLDASFALEPGVGIYIDDIYYGTTFGAVMDLTDLERVEVLRGPQGTLAGKNSVGGAVKLFTAKPGANTEGFIEGTYGSFNRLEVRGSGNIPLTDDLFMRISGVSKNVDGYFDRLDYGCLNPGSGVSAIGANNADCRLGTEGGVDVQALRIALRYAPADQPFEINLRADIASNTSEPVATKLLYADNPSVRSYDAANPLGGVPFDSRFITGPGEYSSYASYTSGGNFTTAFGIPYQVAPGGFVVQPRSTADSWGIAGTVDVELSDSVALTSITGYRVAEGTSTIDTDGSPLNLLLQEFSYRHQQFTQEVRLSADLDGVADITVGGFYYDANDTLKGRAEIPTLLFDFLSDDLVENRSISGFGHAEIHLTNALNVIAGIRYTDDKKTYNFSRLNLDGTEPSGAFFTPNFLLTGLEGRIGTFEGNRWDYRIGFNYRWSDALMTYAQVSTGYKGGGINPRPSAPDQVVTFGPEKLTTYEAGFKSDLFDRRLRLNGAVFLNDYTDIQLVRYQCPESVVLSCSVPSNAGNAEVFGFELEAFAEPVDGLRIDGSVGYLDFDYTEIINPATLVTPDMIAPFISKWQTSAGIQYTAEFSGGATLTPRVDWSYRSSFYYNSINNPFNLIDGYSLFNARLTYESAGRDWAISAAVTNFGDKFYYAGKSENIGSFGVVTGVVGRPREWSLSVKRRF